MKKLIAMMATACAIGAYADWTGKQFSDFEGGVTGDWSYGGDTILGVKDYGDGEKYPGVEVGASYLSIETDTNDAAVKEISEEQTGFNVYVDTLVKFTAFDKEPTVDEGAKIAVWYLEKDAEGEEGQDGYVPGQTNLMVTAGLIDADGNATQKSVALVMPGDFNVNEWHQLKIESKGSIVSAAGIEGLIPNRLGFTIAIDGVVVAATEAFTASGEAYLTDAAKELGAEKKLFPSVTEAMTVVSLAIKGSGSIDNLTIDATEVATEIPVVLTALEGDGYTVTAEPKQALPGTEIEITFTADEGYLFANGEAEIVVKGTLNKDGTVEGVEPQETAEIVAYVGENAYLTIEEAFASVSGQPQEETEIAILVDCKYADGFELAADTTFVVIGTINVDKDGIKLMTEDTTLYVAGEFDQVTSGVEGFETKFDEGDGDGTWSLVKAAEPTEVLPTASVEPITVDGYEAAVKFTALEQGEGYDDWNAKFVLVSDVAIGEGEIELGGSYAAYEEGKWIDITFPGCKAGDEISVAGDLNVTVADLFKFVNEFSCGVKNIGLANDATFTLKLIIVNPDDEKEVKELCKIDNLKVEKAEDNPWKDIEDADIEGEVTEANKDAVETTLGTIAANLGDGADAKAVAGWITKVYGNQKVAVDTIAAAKNIDISVKYDLPLMTAEQPTIEIKQAVDAEEKPVEGFTFQIKDGDTAVSLAAAVDKIQSMVQFTADLKTAFGQSEAKDVTVGLSDDKKTATATFTKATTAGFMKVELK